MRSLFLLALLAGLVAFVGCGKKAPPVTPSPEANPDANANPGPQPQPQSPSEATRFQGSWAVTKLEQPAEDNSTGFGKVSDTDRAKIEVTITDKLVKIVAPTHDGSQITQYAVLSWDMTKTPNEIDLIDSDKTGTTAARSIPTSKGGKATTMEVSRDQYLGIYKFEGETLVIALSFDFQSRPKNFEPSVVKIGNRAVPIMIVHLKKK